MTQPTRSPQRIQIYLKHFRDPEHRYQPRDVVCNRGVKDTEPGCGQTCRRFVTYPREKGMYFDGDPIVVEQFPVRQDGAVIALVETTNVHFATCPARKRPAPPVVGVDGKMAATGGQ